MKTRLEFPELLNGLGLTGVGVEIGIMFGEFSAHMLTHWKGNTLVLIDPWEQQPAKIWLDGCNSLDMEDAYETTKTAVAPFGDRAKILRMYSIRASLEFGDNTLSFCYCDGNHSLASIRADLAAWWPKMKSGASILAGHDYYNRETKWHRCGVKTAVDEFVAKHGLKLETTTDDEVPSWWFFKP